MLKPQIGIALYCMVCMCAAYSAKNRLVGITNTGLVFFTVWYLPNYLLIHTQRQNPQSLTQLHCDLNSTNDIDFSH